MVGQRGCESGGAVIGKLDFPPCGGRRILNRLRRLRVAFDKSEGHPPCAYFPELVWPTALARHLMPGDLRDAFV